MLIDQFISSMQPDLEVELKTVLDQGIPNDVSELRSMLAYHLGWEGEGSGLEAQGKRIRPLLVLLSTASAGGDWKRALPAAAAVELIHNFSLIHDDIQDNSPVRRGRPTVWVKWGIPQAINAGDLMFTLAFYSLDRLRQQIPIEQSVIAGEILHNAIIHLTRGQYLDLSYETRKEIKIDDYWPMVGGKTAALLSASVEIGALVAGVTEDRKKHFRQFGYLLGLAFQAWDDWLGIWGDSALTGKSTESDLVSGKKTLPVLYSLNKKGYFRQRWISGPISAGEVPQLAEILDKEGARTFTENEATRLTDDAIKEFSQAVLENDAARALRELTDRLLQRRN